jgi:hypothetical protein
LDFADDRGHETEKLDEQTLAAGLEDGSLVPSDLVTG